MVAGTWTAWFFFIVTKTVEDSLRDGLLCHDKQLQAVLPAVVGQYLALFVSGLTRDPLANNVLCGRVIIVYWILDYGLRV